MSSVSEVLEGERKNKRDRLTNDQGRARVEDEVLVARDGLLSVHVRRRTANLPVGGESVAGVLWRNSESASLRPRKPKRAELTLMML